MDVRNLVQSAEVTVGVPGACQIYHGVRPWRRGICHGDVIVVHRRVAPSFVLETSAMGLSDAHDFEHNLRNVCHQLRITKNFHK